MYDPICDSYVREASTKAAKNVIPKKKTLTLVLYLHHGYLKLGIHGQDNVLVRNIKVSSFNIRFALYIRHAIFALLLP